MGDVEGQATGLTPSSNARHPVGEGDNIYQCFMFYVINFLSIPDMIDVNFMYNVPRFGGSFSNNVITSNNGRTRSFSCNQAPYEFGNCGSNLRRWTFVWQTNSCEPFIYSGCGGGGNR